MKTQSVGKDKVHREMDLFHDAQEKTAIDSLQFARTHNFLTGSRDLCGNLAKGPSQHTKMLSSQFCLLYQLWFDVFGGLSLQTCYSSVVYLKCLRAFLYLNVKQEPNPKILT